MTPQEILDLNEEAKNLLCEMIREQIVNKGAIITETKVGQSYLEYRFNDGTFLQLSIKNNTKDSPEVLINHYQERNMSYYVEQELLNRTSYTRLSTNSFKVS